MKQSFNNNVTIDQQSFNDSSKSV